MVPLHKKLARKIAFPFVTWTGAERWFTRSKPPGYLILCYHGVDASSSLPYNGRHIPVDVFNKHLQYYRKNFDILPLAELHRRIQEGERPERHTLAITFDDGYRNNLQYALPLLERYEIPATLFAVSRVLTEREHLIWTDWIDLLRFKEGKAPDYEEFNLLSRDERDTMIGSLVDQYGLRDWKNEMKLSFGDLMDPDELLQISQSPWMDVGAHTHGHFDLSVQDAEGCQSELSKSKTLLEDHLQIEVDQLAFPFGRYRPQTLDQAREAGFKSMYSLRYQHATDQAATDLLPRLNVSGTTTYDSQIIYLHSHWKQYAS